MAISFPSLPAGPGLLIPGFFADFDPSRAGYGGPPQRALLIGQTITTVPAVPTYVTTADAAAAAFGAGSVIARMVAAYRLNDSFGELWVLPMADAGGATAATGTIAVTGPATASGTISLYIGGQLVQVGVASGDSATAIATAIGAAINALTSLPVTASVATSNVTLTAKNKGSVGNDIDVRHSFRGVQGGEALPAGVALTVTPMSGGATDPSLATLDATLGEVEYDFIAHPYANTTALDAFRTLMSDSTGRWSWQRQVYGHVWTAKRDTAANLLTLGAARNDQHMTIWGIDGTPTPGFELAAARAGAAAVALRADPARPLQTLPIAGVLAPPVASRFTKSTQNSLLGSGIALSTYDADGTVRIQREVTTYQKGPQGQTDRSYLDAETLFTLMAVVRRLRTAVTTKYARAKLANDGTRFGPGQPVVTPKLFKGELLAAYAAMEADGLVENSDAFAAATIVERDANDPNRMNVLFAPDLINGLRVLGLLVQFRS